MRGPTLEANGEANRPARAQDGEVAGGLPDDRGVGLEASRHERTHAVGIRFLIGDACEKERPPQALAARHEPFARPRSWPRSLPWHRTTHVRPIGHLE